MWTLLGLEPQSVELYEWLLEHPGSDAAQAASALATDPERIREAFRELTSLQLIRGGDKATEPLEPGTALTALARRRQLVLDQAPATAAVLAQRFGAARLRAAPEILFQVLRGREEIVTKLVSLLTAATRSVDWLSSPPFVADLDPDIDAAEMALLSRGVALRGVYDSSVLDSPVHVDNIRQMTDAGSQGRVLPGMDTKLVLFDSTTAVVSLAPSAGTSESEHLVVNYSAMTDALDRLFNFYWSAALPIRFGDVNGDGPGAAKDTVSAQERELLIMLANGMSDAAIARYLQLSDRTYRRRLADLHTRFNVTNRFQLGVAAVEGGLLD